jgi:hypothetical protein
MADIPLDWELMNLDSCSSESATPTPSDSETGDEPKSKLTDGFELRTRYVFVTWTRSTITDPDQFHRKLKEKLPSTTKIFGCQELHKDGTPHYHAVVALPTAPNWTNVREHFLIKLDSGEVDTNALNFKPKPPGMTAKVWIRKYQGYCQKVENPVLIGELLQTDDGQDCGTKRKFDEVIAEEDPEKARQMLQAINPREYVYRYSAIDYYLKDKEDRRKRLRLKDNRSKYDPSSWDVPFEIAEWKRLNIDTPRQGRAHALVLIGESRTGKTSYSTSFGNPIKMTKNWNMRQVVPGATHIVVNDCHALQFGFSGQSYWREVLGCQEDFDAQDRYMKTTSLEWDIPCIWTCNPEMDPRQYPDIAKYLQASGAVVVELGTRRLYTTPDEG